MATARVKAADGRATRNGGLSRLWDERQPAMLRRLRLLEDAAMALVRVDLSDDLRRQAVSGAGAMAAGLGSFRLGPAAELARQLEHLFTGALNRAGDDQVVTIAQKVWDLRLQIEQGASALSDLPAEDSDRGAPQRLLLLSAREDWADAVSLDAEARGIRVQLVRSAAAARDSLLDGSPDLVLIDLERRGVRPTLDLVRELRARRPDLVVLAVSERRSSPHRLAAAQAGVDRFYPHPIAPRQVVSVLLDVQACRASTGAQVLVADADEVRGFETEEVLAAAGFSVVRIRDPRRVWRTLETRRIEHLMVASDLPRSAGLDLCRAVRGAKSYDALPITVLAHDPHGQARRAALRAGADDFLPFPFSPSELIACVRSRIERTRVLSRGTGADEFLGTTARGHAMDTMGKMIRLAARHREPYALAVLKVDNLSRLDAEHGRETRDRVLQQIGRAISQSLRGEDVIASWEVDRFVIGMYGMAPSDGLRRIKEVVARIKAEPVTTTWGRQVSYWMRVGISHAQVEGYNLDALLSRATEAQEQAHSGGDDVVISLQPEHGGDTRTVDVLLIDDDEMVADMLLAPLQGQGYRTARVASGSEAVSALLAPTPTLRPSIVLLEINLPGIDGLALLRRMSERGLTRKCRVIMLTSRSSEADMLQSFEAGAHDYVSKPFSLPVLLQRVHRHLEIR